MRTISHALLLALCTLGCYALSSNIVNEQAEHWKSVSRKYKGDDFTVFPSDCDSKDTQGNRTCSSCLKCTAGRVPKLQIVCMTVTPRLDFRELYVELLMNGTYDSNTGTSSGKYMLLQEIVHLDNPSPKTARKPIAGSGFDDPGVRAFPINIIQRLNGQASMKFCVEAVTGSDNGGFGARWCFRYNGEHLKGISQFIMLGTKNDPARYTPIEYNKATGQWVPVPFNEITP